jgi:CHAT domain-containing protein/Tfp pilus assembly protein PilF
MVFWGLLLVCISIFDFVRIDSRAQSAAPAQSEEAALRAVLENYFAACGKKDLAGVMALWSEKSPNLAAYRQNLEQQFTSEDLSYGSLTVSQVKVEKERAKLRATIALTSINLKSQQKSERRLILNFELVKEAGAWKVWRSASAAEDLAEAVVKAGSQTERAALLAEEREPASAELARALVAQGRRLYFQGSYDQTKEIFELALEVAERSGDKSVMARALQAMGVVQQSQGDYAQALEQYQKALKISQEIGDKRGIADTLNNIGRVYSSQGNFLQALEQYQKSLKFHEEIGNKAPIATILNNIGLIHNSQGSYAQALEHYRKSLKISEEIDSKVDIARALNNIGVVHREQGDDARALEQYQKCLKIWEEIGDKAYLARTLSNVGNVHRSQRDYKRALEQYQKSLKILEEIGSKADIALTLYNIGIVHRVQGDYARALEQYQKSLKISEDIGSKEYMALALNDIGEVYRLSGELQEAMKNFHQAMRLGQEIGGRPGEAESLLGIARIEQKRGALTQARQNIEQAIGIIESLRANSIRQESRASYFATLHEYYESYIDVLMEQHRQKPSAAIDAEAFAVSERARARSLLELLTESRADIRQGVEPALLERERSLQQRLNARAAAQVELLNRKHTSAQAEAAAKEIASLTDEYEEIRAQIRKSSPRYAALTQPQPLNLTEIQQQVLDPDTLLLEYFLGNDASYLFLVSQTSITSYQLPKLAEIEAATRRVRELLTARQPQPGDTEAKYQARVREAREGYWPQAAVLSRMLLGPIASQLGRKRLVIVADGALQYIPFAALPGPSPGNGEGRNSGAEPQPLFVEHEIVSLPSASTLATLRRETAGRKPAEKSLAVLADPVYTDDDTRVRRDVGKVGIKEKTRSADSDELDIASHPVVRSGRETGVIGAEAGFGRLLSTRREAEAISALIPERERMRALDFEASRTTALRPELGEYRIVHFATHGLLNNIHPELSGIVLSLVDEAGQSQDGFLRLQDIYNLKLPAELVVLSACQTGLGKEIKGEGLIGLTRGFMYAGAPRIVASLWKVDDRATSELMKQFYQGLLGPEALRPAAALRQAQLTIWKQKQWQAPYYWAAFVLQGEWK